ncbi:SETX family protein [Megaselia abdita]
MESSFIMENLLNGERFRLLNGSNSIGRMSDNNIRTQSRLVSRKHCSVHVANGSVSIIDMNSANGVFVNNNIIQPNSFINIYEGDRIGIGTNINDNNSDDSTKLMFVLMKLPMKTVNTIDDDVQVSLLTSSIQANQIASSSITPIMESSDKPKIRDELKTRCTSCKIEAVSMKTESNDIISLIGSDSEDEVVVKKERIVGIVDLCHEEEEIVISDDENYLDSQIYSNNIKQELEDLDDFESNDIICIEEQEMLNKWRHKIFRPYVIKPEPKVFLDYQNYTIGQENQENPPTTTTNNQVQILSIVDLPNFNINTIAQNDQNICSNHSQFLEYHGRNYVHEPTTLHNVTDSEKFLKKDTIIYEDIPAILSYPLPKIKAVSSINIETNELKKESLLSTDLKKRRLVINEDFPKIPVKQIKYEKELILPKADDIKEKCSLRRRSKSINFQKEKLVYVQSDIKGKQEESIKKGVFSRISNKIRSKSTFTGNTELAKTEQQKKSSTAEHQNKPTKVKLTVNNRGVCFLQEPPILKTRRNSEFQPSPSTQARPLIKPEERPINGIRNWRSQKLTFGVVNKIENIRIEKTPEILKPCWLQKKAIKKSVRFELPIFEKDKMPKQQIKDFPPKINQQYIFKELNLLISILSWKPDWIKTSHPEFDRTDNKQQSFDYFHTSDIYQKVYNSLLEEHIFNNMRRNYQYSLAFQTQLLHFEKRTQIISFSCLTSIENVIHLNDIVIIYFGNNKSSFKFLGQVKIIEQQNNSNNKIVFMILFEENCYSFLIQNEIKDVYARMVFPYFEKEIATCSAIDNIDSSYVCEMILDPLKICESSDQNEKNIEQCWLSKLSDEQKSIILQTQSMCLDQNKPNIKLIEGPPGSGKSLLIENLILQLLQGTEKVPKILLIAKNDTAVDVVFKKVMERSKSLNLVRYGVDKHIHPKVLDYSINSLITREWSIRNKYHYQKLKKKEIQLFEIIQDYKSNPNKTQAEKMYLQRLEEELNGLRKARDIPKEEKIRLTKHFINKADLVCSTMIGCSRLLNINKHFDICIIDEATQCDELSSLMCLQFGIKHLVLVGETPSEKIITNVDRISQSLFTRLRNRLQSAGHLKGKIHFLEKQYRMHPDIFLWTNEYFYKSTIGNILKSDRLCLFKPYVVFNLSNSFEINYGQGNYSNTNEVNFSYDLLKQMFKKMTIENYSYNIITPYTKQKDEFIRKFSNSINKPFIDTIDTMQGVERDIVLFSNAKTQSHGSLFLQRLNIAFTRAKRCLILIGNFDTLLKTPIWESLVSNAKMRGAYFSADSSIQTCLSYLEQHLFLYIIIYIFNKNLLSFLLSCFI